MQKVKIQFNGTVALLMHADTLADPLHAATKEFRKVSGKRKKTDADHEAMGQQEFIAGVYFENGEVVIPYRNVLRCLIEGARVIKAGPKIERGLAITSHTFPLQYRGPRTPEELYADKNFVARMTVRNGQAKIVRSRPLFRQWGLTVDALVDPTILDVDELQGIATIAGQLIGLGDYRKGGGFGRFEAIVEAN